MDFARPEGLILLLVVPLLGALEFWSRRRRRRDWSALGRSGSPVKLRIYGWLGAAALLAIAIAGPRWGSSPEDLPPGHDIVFLIDVSRSMAVEDAVPDRLGLAVEAAQRLLKAIGREAGSRVGVVAFAGRGVVRCPLTGNLGSVSDVFRSLRPGSVRPGGTDLGAGLLTAMETWTDDSSDEPESGRVVVVFSDGEDLTGGSWRAAVTKLEAAGIIVHAVTIGDAERGHPIPVRDSRNERPETVTYAGATVLSRREDATLGAITDATHGALVRLGLANPEGLDTLFRDRIEPIARLRHQSARAAARIEHFPVFIGAALMLVLLATRPVRRRALILGVGLTLSLIGTGTGAAPESAATYLRQGNLAYARGDSTSALAAFDRAIALDPTGPVPRYDAGAALFRLGRYAEAVARYEEARSRAGAALRTKIDFALGNAAFALGNVPGAIRHYDDCLASHVSGAVYDAVRKDAGINRKFAEQFHKETEPHPESDSGQDAPRPQPRPDPEHPDEDPGTPKAENSPPPSGAGVPKAAPNLPDSSKASSRTPQDRLDEAVKNARDARGRRLADDEADTTDAEHKDW